MPGEDVNSTCPRIEGKFDVGGMISDDEGVAQVNAMFDGSLEQKMGLWLDAGACILSGVRATVDGANGDSLVPQALNDVRIDTVRILQPDDAPGDPVLICDDEQQEVPLEPPKGARSFGEEDDLPGV